MANPKSKKRPTILIVLALLLALLTLAGFLAPYVRIGWLPELQLLAASMPLTLLPWLFFLWRFLRKKAWRWALLSVLGIAAAAYVGSQDFATGAAPGPTEPPALRVLSYNVGTFDFEVQNIRQVADLIEAQAPDIVCLQEFRNQEYQPGQNALEYMAERLGLPHTRFLHLPHHVHGAAFFSRYPLQRIDTLFLPRDEINSGLLATIETPLGTVGVANVHLSSFHIQALYEKEPEFRGKLTRIHRRAVEALKLQEQKVAGILDKLADYDHPLIIAGDLNSTSHSWVVNQLSRRYTDSFVAAGSGNGWTFPYLGILGIRIDYQFFSPQLRCRGLQVIRDRISDHFPLLGLYQTDT